MSEINCIFTFQKKDVCAQLHDLGPTQVKCLLLISSIFDAMNFQHFLEKLEIMLSSTAFPKNAGNLLHQKG